MVVPNHRRADAARHEQDRRGVDENDGDVFGWADSCVRPDKDFNPQPNICESWSVSDDGLLWTFNLQKDKVWSLIEKGAVFFVCGDGRRMEPDVKATLMSIHREKTGGSTAQRNGSGGFFLL